MLKTVLCVLACLLALGPSFALRAQEQALDGEDERQAPAVRGSLVEDRAARKLLEAGDARFESDEFTKAVEVWQSVIERYPRSRVRFDAHLRLGNYLLQRERAYDRARVHFEAAASEENRDQEQRAEATLKLGIAYFEGRNFGKSFQVMRDLIEKFPVSPHVNQAYYYIGLGHFELGHYSRAIAALEKVGTAWSGEQEAVEKVEAGKRLFIKIEDADLAALEPDQTVKVRCETSQGDAETVECHAVGRNVRVVLGSILTGLGRPQPDNRRLEVRGDDMVKVTYLDAHTADRQFDRPVLKEVRVVGDAVVKVTDGAFREALGGTVLGKPIHLEIADADLDLTDAADTLKAVVAVFREKSVEELEAEAAAAAAQIQTTEASPAPAGELPEDAAPAAPEIERYKEIDRVEVQLAEAKVDREAPVLPGGGDPAESREPGGPLTPASMQTANRAEPSAAAAVANASPAAADLIHTGIFRAVVPLVQAEAPLAGDAVLQALPSDIVRVIYLDERHTGSGAQSRLAQARCLEGNLGEVRVARAEISDQELRVQTQLKTAAALTAIGDRYKEFGLKSHAEARYQQALAVCEETSDEARKLGGRLLEESYVQLWQIYYAMEKLELAAAMCQRLQQEFPQSGFVDDALVQLAEVARKQGDRQRAIGIYLRLVAMPTSPLRGEAQFGIAQCYEELALAAQGPAAGQLFDRAFQEYKKVFDHYPDSGRVGEAVAKMANYYYQQKDYARAIDTFETVLASHPDARFLDVILFNYGRCLYRMDRKAEARRQFDQLIADFPESPLAADAKKIAEALGRGAE